MIIGFEWRTGTYERFVKRFNKKAEREHGLMT